MDFDIVIPIGPHDISTIATQLEYTKKNIVGYRHIFLVSFDASLIIEGCITIDERIFPFSLDTVSTFHGKQSRNGWYLQQLLKLYAGLVIPNILEKYLVIDSDTHFLKPTTFVENGKCLYNYGTEYWSGYFIHMHKLHNNLIKVDTAKSGICHHMIFETKYVKELFDFVEKAHGGEIFYNIFLSNVSQDEFEKCGASEYEIYFNYMLLYHRDVITLRPLKWHNSNILFTNYDFDYMSVHWYMK
jgi:hypothetical protein